MIWPQCSSALTTGSYILCPMSLTVYCTIYYKTFSPPYVSKTCLNESAAFQFVSLVTGPSSHKRSNDHNDHIIIRGVTVLKSIHSYLVHQLVFQQLYLHSADGHLPTGFQASSHRLKVDRDLPLGGHDHCHHDRQCQRLFDGSDLSVVHRHRGLCLQTFWHRSVSRHGVELSRRPSGHGLCRMTHVDSPCVLVRHHCWHLITCACSSACCSIPLTPSCQIWQTTKSIKACDHLTKVSE